MKETLLHIYALIVAACALFVIVMGAVVTNSLVVPAMEAPAGLFSRAGHQHAGEAVGVLTMILVAWVWIAGKSSPARRLAWIPLVAVIAQIGLGHASGKASPMVSLLHAFLAPVFLSSVAALALATSPAWRRDARILRDKGWPPMRGLARITLVFVVLQVLLGAAFRHGAMGVMPHIVGALVVIILLLTLVICLTQMPGESLLKPAAITLLVIAGVQIFLGLTVVSMSDKAMAGMAGLVFSCAHVALGALTLATSVVVAMEARRSVRPAV
jgi:heme A synthase